MRAPIAKIRINAGNPGWYDPLTNIHLTITRPEAFVYEGSNTTNIKRSISHGLVHIIEGSLEDEKATREAQAVKEVREVAPQVEVKTEEVVTNDVIPEEIQEVTEVTEEVAKEEVAKEEVVEEEVVEEEVVEEKPKAKKTTKKKATKKEKDAE